MKKRNVIQHKKLIKMGIKFLTFGDIETEKNNFCRNKYPIL